jgi:EKC/KEOPS complex subunit PCC1/LAGE3
MATETSHPCKLTIRIPFPSAHLARTAFTTLSVDKELSSSVERTFSLGPVDGSTNGADLSVLVVEYAATTNRMLRVSVNGFFDTLAVVIQCMEELDLDVVEDVVKESLDRVQGLEEGIK